MALILDHFYSAALTECNSLTAVVPVENNEKSSYPVLWLLPPVGCDHTAWQRHTAVEDLADELGIIIVMPDLKLSYGLDMTHGFAYFQMLTKELPEMIADYFPADLGFQMIAGVKEGGYAALKAALSVPGQYRMAASYSCGSLTDETFDPELDKQLDNAFGTSDLQKLNGTYVDLKILVKTAENHDMALSLEYSEKDEYHASSALLADSILKSSFASRSVRVQKEALTWAKWAEALKMDVKNALERMM